MVTGWRDIPPYVISVPFMYLTKLVELLPPTQLRAKTGGV